MNLLDIGAFDAPYCCFISTMSLEMSGWRWASVGFMC